MHKSLVFAALTLLFGVFGFAVFAQALSLFDITYPIPELGNCQDQNECKAYCDDFSHADACVAFAEKFGIEVQTSSEQAKQLPPTGPGNCKSQTECQAYCEDSTHLDECIEFGKEHGFISDEEYENAKEFSGQTGPGGCKGANECRSYCEDSSHLDECLEFGQRQGLISDKDLEVARTLEKGGPGGCKSENECRAYCDDPAHINECADSAVELGFMTAEEAQRVKKFAVTDGPGGCKGQECRTYCEDSSHQQECIDFAEQNGLMSPEDVVRARKFAGKTGPGGCKGEECRTYCESPEHGEECLAFAEQEGLIPAEELQHAKKFLQATQQGGPGGCKGAACRDYCGDSAHQEECFSFAKNQGLLSAEDEQHFETGRKLQKVMQESGGPGGCKTEGECRTYCTDGSHVEECIAFGSTHGGVPEEQARAMLSQFIDRKDSGAGEFRPPQDFRQFEEQAHQKFQEFRALEEGFRGEGFGPSGQAGGAAFAGPGGCTSPSECIKFCTEHKEECFSFGGPGQSGATPPQGGLAPGREGGFPGRSEFRPQLQQNLIIQFKEGELPQFGSQEEQKKFFQENFNDLRENIGSTVSEEQRRQIFEQKFQEFRGEPNQFPGQEQIPQGQFPQQPPEGFKPPEGFTRPEGQVEQQFQQEFQRQVEQQTQQFPTGEFKPSEGQFQPAPIEQFAPPPTTQEFVAPPPPPEGGSVIDATLRFFQLRK